MSTQAQMQLADTDWSLKPGPIKPGCSVKHLHPACTPRPAGLSARVHRAFSGPQVLRFLETSLWKNYIAKKKQQGKLSFVVD